MPGFTIEGRLKHLPDVQRTWLWELIVPDIGKVTDSMKTEEPLVIRCRTAVIPARGNEAITSNFMGLVQHFPGKPTFDYSFETLVEETEDQIVAKALNEWNTNIFDVDPTSPTGGHSRRTLKRSLTSDIKLLMYKYDGTQMGKIVKFVNAYPENVGAVTLDYTATEPVRYPVTWRYDFWLLTDQ